MKDITVIPAIMPSVNWGGISTFFRSIGLEDPIKQFDSKRIKQTDPATLIQGFGAPTHCILGFLVFIPNCTLTTLASISTCYGLEVKVLSARENDYLLLISGDFTRLKTAVLLACQESAQTNDRMIFSKILEAIEMTGLKQYFKDYAHMKMVDGSIVCS